MSVHVQQITRAAEWFLRSGIQGSQGGVARFYRSDQKKPAAVSTEITGYFAGYLAGFSVRHGDPALLSHAVLAADFLLDHAWDAALGTFPFELPLAGLERAPAYFFDCGIIARGLLSVWRHTGTLRYRGIAEKCAQHMAVDFDAAGFDFHPVLHLPTKTPALRDARWSQSSGCYQLKAALAFHEVAHLTSSSALHDAWHRVRAQALADHDQFLPGHADEARVMDRLHAYCYFLEALLIAPTDAESGRAIALGIQRVAYLLHRIAPVFVRSDVYAQLLRVRIYADSLHILPLDTHTAALEIEQLRLFQARSEDVREDGGFYFGRKGTEMLPYINPVSTAFAMQALQLWDAVQSGTPLPPVSELL